MFFFFRLCDVVCRVIFHECRLLSISFMFSERCCLYKFTLQFMSGFNVLAEVYLRS